jgi:orotate phosphoribosyltransferase
MECFNLIKKSKSTLVGFAAIIDRSTKKTLKIKKKIISHLKIEVPTYKPSRIPKELDSIPISSPGSRFIK